MRLKLAVATALSASLIAGVFAAPAPAAPEEFGMSDPQSHVVDTRHGKIYVTTVHPTTEDGKIVKAPAIFTYSPYAYLGFDGANFRRTSGADDWVPRGYVRVFADVVGTGNSGGCYDYGGMRERESGYDLVEWIAKQKWSTGKVAMTGGSYEGTTATATAIENPPHLTTIVPEAAISRWYEYAYSGGIRYFLNNESLGHQGPGAVTDEGFDTPLAFDFGLAIPPPLDATGPGWMDRVESTVTPCEEIAHTQHGYDDTPDYDKFWKERDYIIDAGKIDIPVLVAHNWGDWNVKQEEAWNLYHALDKAPKKVLYMGTRWSGHGTPAGDYDKVKRAWMDHYLKGVDNGIEKLPTVVSQTSTQSGPGKFLAGKPKVKNVTLYAQEGVKTNPNDYAFKLLATKPRKIPGFGPPSGGGAAGDGSSFPSAGANTESHALHHSRTNHDWFWFESPHLKKDVRIFGEIKVQHYSKVAREWVTLTPTIADVDSSKHINVAGQHAGPQNTEQLIGVTRGFLDSRYRKGLSKQVPIEPNKPFQATVALKPQDYVFEKGHYIGLNVQTEINEWALPKPYPCSSSECSIFDLLLDEGKFRLILPIVDAPKNANDLFDFGHGHH